MQLLHPGWYLLAAAGASWIELSSIRRSGAPTTFWGDHGWHPLLELLSDSSHSLVLSGREDCQQPCS